jgi:hypothetical protein
VPADVPVVVGAVSLLEGAALEDALRSSPVRLNATTPATRPNSNSAAATPAAAPCSSVSTVQFVARLEGRPVSVSVRGDEATVYDASTCAVVAVFTL